MCSVNNSCDSKHPGTLEECVVLIIEFYLAIDKIAMRSTAILILGDTTKVQKFLNLFILMETFVTVNREYRTNNEGVISIIDLLCDGNEFQISTIHTYIH